jgi:hypothetical protein
MRTRHVQIAHMTVLPPRQEADADSPSAPPRTYSTERYVKVNNGIAIPQQLRDRMDAMRIKTEEACQPLTFLPGGRGFF